MKALDSQVVLEIQVGYIDAMLWSSTDSNDEPLDDNYFHSDLSIELIKSTVNDIETFYKNALQIFDKYGAEMELDQLGHDLWLTRCGHGAGFWDRGLGKLGDELTELCKDLGNLDICVGDDGKLY